ncbi:MAG: hypothetical protein WAN76_04235 [Candidatus Sulfotelmatobacter sp.]
MKFLLLSRRQQTRYILPKSGPCADAFIVAMGLAPGAQAQYYKYTALDAFTGLQKRFFRTQY